MEFTPASQNGVTPPTELKTWPSRFALAISNTSTYYGRPVVLKALSDAAMYKTEPVTFYSQYTTGTTTSTIVLGTATFQSTAVAPLVLNSLSTGTHRIWATWPGQGRYAGQSTEQNPVLVDIASGVSVGGTMNLTVNPASGSLVVGEGTATFSVLISAPIQLIGNVLFFVDNTQIGSEPITNNSVSFTTDAIPAGSHTITAQWPGATINGIPYQGLSVSIPYTILRGSTLDSTLTLSIDPSPAVLNEGIVNLTAALNTTTSLAGNVTFYVDGQELYSVPLTGNQANTSILNSYATGTHSISAVWDGNQSSHPRYIEKATTSSWEVVERGTLPGLTLFVTPKPTSTGIQTKFIATINTTTNVDGIISFVDQGNGLIGTAPLVNNSATLITQNLTDGEKIVYAYYPGSATAPKYYPLSSNTQTLTVYAGLYVGSPINLNIKSNNVLAPDQFVVDEPVKFVSSISTSLSLTNVVKLFANSVPVAESRWINNTATTTTSFASTGNVSVFSYWVGDTINGNFYGGYASSTTSITIQERANLTYDLVLTANQSPANISANTSFTVTATTTTNLTGKVEFYEYRPSGVVDGDYDWDYGTNYATLDPYWSNVVLYQRFENTLNDLAGKCTISSSTNVYFVQTPTAPPVVNSPRSGNYILNKSYNGYVKYSPNTRFDFGTGDFTIEYWMWMSNYGTKANFVNFVIDNNGNINDTLTPNHAGGLWTLMTDVTGNPGNATSTSTFSWGLWDGKEVQLKGKFTNIKFQEWHHYAISRKNGILYTAVDGNIINAGPYTRSIAGFQPQLGNNVYGEGNYAALYDELRVTAGVARYTEPFVPVLLGTSTFATGVANITFVGNTFVTTGTHQVFAKWLGSDVAPKFYPKTSNTATQIIT